MHRVRSKLPDESARRAETGSLEGRQLSRAKDQSALAGSMGCEAGRIRVNASLAGKGRHAASLVLFDLAFGDRTSAPLHDLQYFTTHSTLQSQNMELQAGLPYS